MDSSPLPGAHTGWLQKRGEYGLRTWARRYFETTLEGIEYYLDETKKVRRGIVKYSDIISVTNVSYGVLSSDGYFEISTRKKIEEGKTDDKGTGRIYYLFAASKEEAVEWVSAINKWKEFSEDKDKTPATPINPCETTSTTRTDSPYAQFLDFQATHANSAQPILHNTPLDLDYIASSTIYYNPLQPPTAPPRPLRQLSDFQVQEVLLAEGDILKGYIDAQINCCNILMSQNLNMTSNITLQQKEKKSSLLCAYLVLCGLDWDNRNTPPTPFPCSPSYESDSVFSYFVYAISLVRQDILDSWPIDGATVVTQIDTWIKRKRMDHQILVQQEDRQAFLNRNLVLIYQIKQAYLTRFPQLDDALAVLIDRFLDACDRLPQTRYGELLWKGVESRVPEQDRAGAKALLWGYLIFQKLKLENDKVSFTSRDPYLSGRYLTILNNFQNAIAELSLSHLQRDTQITMMKIFGMWQRDLPLLNLTLGTRGEVKIIALSNARTVSRVLARLASVNASSQLCDALSALKVALYQEYSLEATGGKEHTPFPALPSQTRCAKNADDMQELLYIAERIFG